MLALACAADTLGLHGLSHALIWQSSLFQNDSLHQNPDPDDATAMYEGTPLVLVVFVESILSGILIYGVAGVLVLKIKHNIEAIKKHFCSHEQFWYCLGEVLIGIAFIIFLVRCAK
jgi:hypothetical protein